MPADQLPTTPPPAPVDPIELNRPSQASATSSSSTSFDDEKKRESAFVTVEGIPPLAERTAVDSDSSITASLARFLRLRKRKAFDGLDEVATQPSVYDTEQAAHYTPRADWENISAFDPLFRCVLVTALSHRDSRLTRPCFAPSLSWTWREEKSAVRKVDWKIFVRLALRSLLRTPGACR